MKRILASALLLSATYVSAGDIMLSKSIKADLRHKMERDLSVIENFQFSPNTNAATLKVMGISSLNAQTATQWLNDRVSYIISENALSIFNLLVKKTVYVEKSGVEYPSASVIPYSLDFGINQVDEKQESFTVMSNVGSALYFGGKKMGAQYGMKISRGLLHKAERVLINSPRTGIIQIGEGLFAPELTVNRNDEGALANSIFRLGTFFHEARHSDGNGRSLGFLHAICPAGHDYENQPACDENLNGPYTVGALMMGEMAKSCGDNCSEKDKQTLKILVLDSANRILSTTHRGEKAKEWDARPESL